MWDNHLSYRETAAYFDIRKTSALGEWERLYHIGGIEALSPGKRGKFKKMRGTSSIAIKSGNDETRTREQLLEELNYLRMENAYLKKLEALIQASKKSAQSKKHK